MIELPGATADAEATWVIERSAPKRVADAVVVLFPVFGSVPVSLTVTEFIIVEPIGSSGVNDSTIVIMADAPALRFPVAVQVIAPVPPTAGTVPHVQPAGGVAETNRLLVAVFWVSVTPPAATVALLFVTVSAKVIALVPIVDGAADSVT